LYILRSAFGLGAADTVNLVIDGVATAAAPTFLYDSAIGFLSFDADGSGAGAAVDFVNIGANIGLSAADIVLYG
jgi:Ca2+-binding RTX toxin-like protein